MKEKINIMNGSNFVTETQATLLIDKSNFVYAGDGVKVGYQLYIEVDKKDYRLQWDGSDFYIEIIGMTKEDWKKYNYDKLIK